MVQQLLKKGPKLSLMLPFFFAMLICSLLSCRLPNLRNLWIVVNLKLETRNLKLYSRRRGAVAQFGRAPRSQCGGQGFEPPLLHQ